MGVPRDPGLCLCPLLSPGSSTHKTCNPIQVPSVLWAVTNFMLPGQAPQGHWLVSKLRDSALVAPAVALRPCSNRSVSLAGSRTHSPRPDQVLTAELCLRQPCRRSFVRPLSPAARDTCRVFPEESVQTPPPLGWGGAQGPQPQPVGTAGTKTPCSSGFLHYIKH